MWLSMHVTRHAASAPLLSALLPSSFLLRSLLTWLPHSSVIGIPIGLFLTFGPMQAGLHGLWTGLTVALAFGAAMSLALISRTNWDAEVDKAARLSGEQAPLLGPVGEAARTRTETGAA